MDENEKKLYEQSEDILKRGVALAESTYGKYTIPVLEYMDRKKKPVPRNVVAATGYCMRNFEEAYFAKLNKTPFFEAAPGATTGSDIKFINWAFQLMSALLPNLVADQIFSVQPMERRQAQIFYLNIEAASNKGKVKIGDKLATVESGFNADYSYPLQLVKDEEIGVGDGGTANYTGNLTYVPQIEGCIEIRAIATDDSELVVIDDGAGNLTGDIAGGVNTITYSSGAFNVTFSKNIKALEPINGTYEYRMDIMPENTPKIKLSIDDSFIRAITASLGAIWILHAGYDLQKAHGISARDVLLETQAGLLRRGTDHYLLNMVREKATGGNFTFPYTAPTGVNVNDHFDSFRYKLTEQSTTIAKNTRMNAGNLIICGQYAYVVISGMRGFERTVDIADAPQGPVIVGKLDNYTVVFDPDYPVDEWVMGFKGGNYLQANFIYAPYMPFFTSEIVWLNFFEGQQGTGTAFGAKMIRPAGYTKGKILLT